MSRKIVVFGSVNLDHVYAVDHLTRPGETISSSDYHVFWGGKGLNQAIALSRAGAPTYLAAKVSASERAKLERLCADSRVDSSLLVTADVPTGHAIIQVDHQGQNGIIVYPGANGTFCEADIDRVLSALQPEDCILLQNEINLIPEIIEKAKARGLRVILNPSPISEEMLHWPLEKLDLLIVNEIEGGALSGKTEPSDILDEMRRRWPDVALALTVGKDGSYYQRGSKRIYQPAFSVKVTDTTAAGDTFTGFFLARLLAGGTVQEALNLAAKAAAIAVSRQGATVSIPVLADVIEKTM